jgi:hypothetical protein
MIGMTVEFHKWEAGEYIVGKGLVVDKYLDLIREGANLVVHYYLVQIGGGELERVKPIHIVRVLV